MVAFIVVFTVVLTVLALGVGWAVRSRIGQTPERERLRARTAGLTWADRWRVYRAVTKGRAVTDPALTAAAVARARYTRAYGRRVTTGRWRWVLPVMAVLQFLVAGGRFLGPGTTGPGRWVGAGSSLALGVLLLGVPWQWRFYSRRADRAEQLNLGLLYAEQQQAQR